MSRKSYKDARSIGRSELVPFDPHEGWRSRHLRRKAVNLTHQAEFEQWCAGNGWKLKIHNDGHHWMLKKAKFYIQWWPASAKVVINEKWDKGIHCHDYEQLKRLLIKQK